MRASFIFLASLIIIIFLLSMSVFTVAQYQSAIVLRLGQIVNSKNNQPMIAGPGLHFRWPFIEDVNEFDMRVRTLQSSSERVMTAEQKELSVNAYVKWKISNPVAYYESTSSNSDLADSLLQQALQDAMRNQFGQMTISDLIDAKREQMMASLFQALQAPAAQLGIQIIDVRIETIELPPKVQDSVFARMRSKRENDAASYRAQGLQTAEQIKADADANAAVIISTANSQAAKTRADGEAKALQIVASTYAQNPDFYGFFRSLQVYQAAFANQHATLVLSPSGQLFKYFNPNSSLGSNSSMSNS